MRLPCFSLPARALALFSAASTALALAACGGSGSSTSAATTASTTDGAGAGGSTGSASGGNGGEGGTLPPAQPLKIMDWNTHDYFDSSDNPATDDTVLTKANYTKKRDTIGAQIKAMNADLVMLAEVENQAILDDMNAADLGGKYTTRVLIQGNDERGINVGFLSTIAPDMVVSHKDDEFTLPPSNLMYKYSRDCLEVHLTFNGRHVVLLGVHFKAKTPPDDPDKRLAESLHTRAIADALVAADPSLAVLVLGDYNDTPDSTTIAGMVGKAPVLFVDSASFGAGTPYSYVYEGMNQLIDHQFANPRMAGLLDQTSVIISHGPGIDDDNKYSSDHAPVTATYMVH